MEKLPSVYVNPINKKINNEQETYRSTNKGESNKNNESISFEELNKILNEKHTFIVNVNVLINNEYESIKVLKINKDYLLTIDNLKIPLNVIKDMKINQ